MTKTDLIAQVAANTEMSKKSAEQAVNAVFEALGKAMTEGEKISISGFGTFEVRERAERQGIHPLAIQKHILTFAQYNFGSTLYIKYFLPNQRRVYQCCHKLPFGRESQLVKHLHSLSQLQIITLLAIEPQQ